MNKVNQRELQLLLQEANELSTKNFWTKAQERRNAYLLSAISAVKSGVSLSEIDQDRLNEEEVRHGFKPTRINRGKLTEEQRARAAFMARLVNSSGTVGAEFRDETAGTGSGIGSYSGAGYLVPTEFYGDVFGALKNYDPILDGDVCTRLDTDNGCPMSIPTMNDTGNDAVLIGEVTDTTNSQVDFSYPSLVKLGADSFRTPVHKFSYEAAQDVGGEAFSVYSLAKRFLSARLARGIGKVLMTGDGINKSTTGLLVSLAGLGITPVTSASTTAITSAEIGKLVFSIDRAWRESDKCAFLMNTSTCSQLSQVITSSGLPLVNFRDGLNTILGFPVYESPSMDSPGNGKVPVLFGDLSQFVVRVVSDDQTRIRVLTETPGLAEKGQIGIQFFCRASGVLAFAGSAADTPCNYIINHS